MTNILTGKFINIKSKFIELCQADGTDKISNFEYKIAVADKLRQAFKSNGAEFTDCLNYWDIIKGEFKQPPTTNNTYEVMISMLDHMIRCAKLNAFL